MKEAGAGSQPGASSTWRSPLRQLLVVVEVALALVLVIAATLALRSFARLINVHLGFRPDHILTMRFEFPPYQFTKPGRSIDFVRQVLRQVRTISGLEGASTSPFAPFSGWEGETTFKIEGALQAESSKDLTAEVNGVAPGYFNTMRIPLLAGRDFSEADRKGAPLVYIVNQALAKKYFGSESPIGKQLTTAQDENQKQIVWREIIGEVGDTHNQSAKAAPKPELYCALYQGAYLPSVSIAVRTKVDPLAVASLTKDRVWLLDKDLPITEVKTMDQWIEDTNATPRFQTMLLGIFGVLGLTLALLGIYGVVSYSVTQRTHEIGIRIALGAEPKQVLRLILGQGLKLVLVGVVIGIAAAPALTRLMASLLFGVSTSDPLTFAGVAVLLLIVALVACYIPSRRAMRVGPMVGLRYE
jgi:predicted permease